MEKHHDAKTQWGLFFKRSNSNVEDKQKIQTLIGGTSNFIKKAKNEEPGSILSKFANLQ